jgi:hypothetical protein
MQILYFYRENTPECQVTRQTLNNYLNTHNLKFTVKEINFDTGKSACEKYRVYGVPTVIITNHDKILGRHSGLLDLFELDKIFGPLINDTRINLNTTKNMG